MKRKVGRPRSENKRIAFCFKMPPEIRNALAARCKATGENISGVILKALVEELEIRPVPSRDFTPIAPTPYGNAITDKIRRMLLDADIPPNSVSQIINSACRDFGMTPKALRKKQVTQEFIDNLCKRVDALCAIDESCCAMMKKSLKAILKD